MAALDNGGTQSPFSDAALRHIAQEKILWRVSVYLHGFFFISVNLLLIIINLSFLPPGLPFPSNMWFVYVLSGWIIGYGIHLAAYFIYSRGVIGDSKKAIIFHGVIQILSVQALFLINLISYFEYQWFWWPVIFGFVAWGIHLAFYLVLVRSRIDKNEQKSWLQRKVDEQMERLGGEV